MKNPKTMNPVMLFLAAALAGLAGTYAQTVSLTGTVTDANGAKLKGAKVVLLAAHGAVADTKVKPVGVVSDNCTACASDGPLLVTVIVYDTLLPGVTVADPVLTTDRSAEAQQSRSLLEL